MFRLTDYNRRDISSYFSGTDVVYWSEANEVFKVGNVVELTESIAIILPTSGITTELVRLATIQWDGIYPQRLLTNNGRTYIAGPIGARVYKKGMVRENFGVVQIRPMGTNWRPYPQPVNSRVRSDLYPKYLLSLAHMYNYIRTDESLRDLNTKQRIHNGIDMLGKGSLVCRNGDSMYGVGLMMDGNVQYREVNPSATSYNTLRNFLEGTDNG